MASLAFVGGCVMNGAPSAPPPLSPAAQSVQVLKSDPPRSCRDLGPLEAVHGSGCGGFGSQGTYEGAYNELRNMAAARGANYVRMDSQFGPHSENGCFDDRFVIRGVAFACGAAPAMPASAATPATP